MKYSTRHVCTLFRVSPETARTWAEEFSQYLSPVANPGTGRHRQFTDEDMRVLSLVSQMKRDNLTFNDIHAALASGNRGQAPALPVEEVQALVVGERESQLIAQMSKLQQAIVDLQKERDMLLPSRENEIRLLALRESDQKRIAELTEQLNNAQDKIEKLNREIGRLESRMDD